MMEINPPDYYLKLIIEYVIDMVWLRRLMVAIKYALRLSLDQADY